MFVNRIESTLPCAQMLRVTLCVGIWSENFLWQFFPRGRKKLSGSSIGNESGIVLLKTAAGSVTRLCINLSSAAGRWAEHEAID
jgi:hypothetical protein